MAGIMTYVNAPYPDHILLYLTLVDRAHSAATHWVQAEERVVGRFGTDGSENTEGR